MSFLPAHPPERFAHAQHLYETTTLSNKKIGAETGVASSTVGTWAHRNAWRRPGEAEPRSVRKPAVRAKQPTAAGGRRSLYLAIVETADEARRQIAEFRAGPPLDLIERERHARTVAHYVRTLRQSKELLVQIGAAPHAAQPKGNPRDGDHCLDQGRSLAELRDEFVRLLACALADGPDGGGPRPL